jgi:hypothetical protein
VNSPSLLHCSITITRTVLRTLALIARHRRQLLTYLSQPLLHTTVFLLQIMAVSLIARKYNGYYAKRPVLTTMITNAVRLLVARTPVTPR